MKTVRKDWPRVRSYVKGGNVYYQVDLRRKHHRGQKWRNFTSRDEALKFAAETGDKIAKQGLNSLLVETEDKRVEELRTVTPRERMRLRNYPKKKTHLAWVSFALIWNWGSATPGTLPRERTIGTIESVVFREFRTV